MNVKLPNLSVNYSSVSVSSAAPSETGDGDLLLITGTGFTDEMRMIVACD